MVSGPRRLSDHNQEIRKVGLEIAGSGQARLWRYTYLKLCVGDREGAGKITESAKGSVTQDPGLLATAKLIKETAEPGNEKHCQATLLWSLDEGGHVPRSFGKVSDSDEENGLADTSEAEKHHALGVSASLNSSQGDLRRRKQLVATGQGWRPRSRSGREWVSDRIHRIPLERVMTS